MTNARRRCLDRAIAARQAPLPAAVASLHPKAAQRRSWRGHGAGATVLEVGVGLPLCLQHGVRMCTVPVLAFLAYAITNTKRHELLAALQTWPHLLDVLGITGGNLGTTVRRALLLARLKARVIHVVSSNKGQKAELDQGEPGHDVVRIARSSGRGQSARDPPRNRPSVGPTNTGPWRPFWRRST